MSKKQLKKGSSNVSFSLSRWFRRFSANTPSTLIIIFAGLAYCVFLFGGGLYTLIFKPIPSAYIGNMFFFLSPGISRQFTADTLISATLYALGLIGLIFMYRSTKSFHAPRQAYMMLIVGVAFVFIAYIFLEGSISFKSYWAQYYGG
jgi:hypothetical protein